MTPLYLLLVVHPAGLVSTWVTDDQREAFRPCFGPRSWPAALAMLPETARTIQVRLERDATDWPDRADRWGRS